MRLILLLLLIPSVSAFGVTQLDESFYVIGNAEEQITVSGVVEEEFFLQKGEIREVKVTTKMAGDIVFSSGQNSISFFVPNPIVYDVDEKVEYLGVIAFNLVGLIGGIFLWKKKVF